MTRKQYTELFAALKSVQSLIGSPTFSYAVAMNLHTLEKEITALKAVYNGKPQHTEFEKTELEVINSFCEKNEKGEPLGENGRFVIPEKNTAEFEKAITNVYSTFATEKAEYSAFDEKVVQLLEEEITIELLKITKDELPKEISPLQVSGLLPIIEY